MNRSMALPTLEGSQFSLRPFRSQDEESLQVVLDDERVARKVSHIPLPYTREHAHAWVTRCESVVTPASKRVDFVIDVGGEVAGSMAFINIDDHKAQVSYWISPAYWGKGIATEALQMLLHFGFVELGLVRIYAYVYEQNKASARVLEKAGFRYEGTLRKEWHKYFDDEDHYYDSRHYAIVDDEYLGKEQE